MLPSFISGYCILFPRDKFMWPLVIRLVGGLLFFYIIKRIFSLSHYFNLSGKSFRLLIRKVYWLMSSKKRLFVAGCFLQRIECSQVRVIDVFILTFAKWARHFKSRPFYGTHLLKRTKYCFFKATKQRPQDEWNSNDFFFALWLISHLR